MSYQGYNVWGCYVIWTSRYAFMVMLCWCGAHLAMNRMGGATCLGEWPSVTTMSSWGWAESGVCGRLNRHRVLESTSATAGATPCSDRHCRLPPTGATKSDAGWCVIGLKKLNL